MGSPDSWETTSLVDFGIPWAIVWTPRSISVHMPPPTHCPASYLLLLQPSRRFGSSTSIHVQTFAQEFICDRVSVSVLQEKSQQCHLLLNMMIFQSIGDVSGRMLAPTSKRLGQISDGPAISSQRYNQFIS